MDSTIEPTEHFQNVQSAFDAVTIIDVLHDMEKRMEITNGSPIRVYFAGCDGKSNFDIKSNKFEMCVLASDATVGSVLLRILRYCIDGQSTFGIDKMLSKDNINFQSADPYENFILYLCNRELLVSFDITDNSIVPITNIDIWTIPRLISAFPPNSHETTIVSVPKPQVIEKPVESESDSECESEGELKELDVSQIPPIVDKFIAPDDTAVIDDYMQSVSISDCDPNVNVNDVSVEKLPPMTAPTANPNSNDCIAS